MAVLSNRTTLKLVFPTTFEDLLADMLNKDHFLATKSKGKQKTSKWSK